MSITLAFNVKPGDTFQYQATFASRRGGTPTANTMRTGERIVAVTPDSVHVVQLEDPEELVTVLDRSGRPIDVLQGGASIKNDVASDMFDISNQLIFPSSPVNPGDTWEAADGVVRVVFRLIGTSTLGGRAVAEVHSTSDGYNGPIKHWVELATGRLARKEYVVGAGEGATTTTIERV